MIWRRCHEVRYGVYFSCSEALALRFRSEFGILRPEAEIHGACSGVHASSIERHKCHGALQGYEGPNIIMKHVL